MWNCNAFYATRANFTVKGEERNFKLTHQQDIYLADHIIQDGLHEYHQYSEAEIELKLNDKVIVVLAVVAA